MSDCSLWHRLRGKSALEERLLLHIITSKVKVSRIGQILTTVEIAHRCRKYKDFGTIIAQKMGEWTVNIVPYKKYVHGKGMLRKCVRQSTVYNGYALLSIDDAVGCQ